MKWQGGSFAGLFLWVGAVSASILAYGGLPSGIGWLGIAATALAIVATLEIVRLVRRDGMEELARLTRPPAARRRRDAGGVPGVPALVPGALPAGRSQP